MQSDSSLLVAPDGVFRVWGHRLKIELEAAALFAELSRSMRELRGEFDEIAKMADQARIDEERHAGLCRDILKHSPVAIKERAPNLQVQLGPSHLSLQQRVLYTSVAVGCVTESLSTSLLLEMKKRAEPGLISHTIREILIDEVNHSRIGWAELARSAQEQDVSWLADHLPAMVSEAIQADVKPMLSDNGHRADLCAWGILPAEEAKFIMVQTINEVIVPGLRQFGVR